MIDYDKAYAELFPLCTATGAPVCSELEEERLTNSMSIDERVIAKLQAGIEPHESEYQFCQLPYDLPGEVWKPFPDFEGYCNLSGRFMISNKLRIKTIYNNTIRHQRRTGESSVRDENQKSFSANSKRLAYMTFGRCVAYRYPYTRRQLQINFKINTDQKLDYTDYRDNRSLIDMPGEVWKPISGFNGVYEVSSYGRIKSNYHNFKTGDGLQLIVEHIFVIVDIPQYYGIILSDENGGHHTFYIHHLVLKTFSPRSEKEINLGKDQIDHINGNKHDNRLCNLRWLTISENVRASNNLGKGNTKLTMDVLMNLGHEYDECHSVKALAEKYHIGQGAMMDALKGISFSDVKRYIPPALK